MQIISQASGGIYTNFSNADDILGQIVLAKNKIGYESLTGEAVFVHDPDMVPIPLAHIVGGGIGTIVGLFPVSPVSSEAELQSHESSSM